MAQSMMSPMVVGRRIVVGFTVALTIASTLQAYSQELVRPASLRGFIPERRPFVVARSRVLAFGGLTVHVPAAAHTAEKVENDKIKRALNSRTDLAFDNRPLRDVLSYAGDVHDISIELDPALDGKAKVTIRSTERLRDALTELLKPLGLEFVAEKNRVLIRQKAKTAGPARRDANTDVTIASPVGVAR